METRKHSGPFNNQVTVDRANILYISISGKPLGAETIELPMTFNNTDEHLLESLFVPNQLELGIREKRYSNSRIAIEKYENVNIKYKCGVCMKHNVCMYNDGQLFNDIQCNSR